MRVLISAFLVALSLAVFVGCGGGGSDNPSQTTGSLAGYIYDDGGAGMIASAQTRAAVAPLVGATITVSGQSISATTDGTGYFQLDGVRTGSRQFYVEAGGHTRATFTMTISTGPNTIPTGISLEAAPLKWMVMVYMAADNDLDYNGNFAAQDLNEMEAGTPVDSPDVMTVVLSDRSGANDTKIYQIKHDTNPSVIASDVIYTPPTGELDTGLPSTLDWFVDYCQSTGGLPRAEHYLLVLWDHGSGWSSYDDRSLSARAIGWDERTNNMMRIVDIAPVLESNTYPIDIIASDACLMSQLEVAYEWKACGDYLVASEELTPGVGFNYTSVMSFLTSSQALQMTSGQLANGLAQTVYNVWVADYMSGNPPPVISVIDLRKLGPVAAALDAFSGRLRSIGGSHAAQLSRIYDDVEEFGYWWDDHRVDLYDYANRVAAINDSSLRTAAGQLKTAIDAAVTAEYHNTQSPGAHGISIYLPQKAAYTRDAAASYPGLKLSADTRWNEWLANQPAYVAPTP
ncbi:MAG: clostripain-related cysteine peptidase [Armatimonadota bacterium]